MAHDLKTIQSLFTQSTKKAIAIKGFTTKQWEKFKGVQKSYVSCKDFTGKVGDMALLTDGADLQTVYVGLGDGSDMFAWAIGDKLPHGVYTIQNTLNARQATGAMVAWGLSLYTFDRYKPVKHKKTVKLVPPKNADGVDAVAQIAGVYLGRDMVNTPANDLGPKDMTVLAKKIARDYGASIEIINVAKKQKEFPMIHAVGKGSAREPYLIDISWSAPQSTPQSPQSKSKNAKSITLVGKGVVFDTGGYNLKPGSGLFSMKIDMGGAAVALSIARMIMQANVQGINLRVLIPTVENSVSGTAYRPSDVIQSRGGISVEIGNTDAEGRLILGDALTYACESKPDLMMDFATLTGAGRIALGPEITALFCEDEKIARSLVKMGRTIDDQLWHMPLHGDYGYMLDSKTADTNNIGQPWGGAITAGLFLQKFVDDAVPWVHCDIMAANTRARLGRPEGGEPMSARATYEYVKSIL